MSTHGMHMVSCVLDSLFQGDELDVVVNTTYDAQGVPHQSMQIEHSAMSEADTTRVVVQLEYMCDNSIVQKLKTGSSAQPSPLMKWHDYMIKSPDVYGMTDTGTKL